MKYALQCLKCQITSESIEKMALHTCDVEKRGGVMGIMDSISGGRAYKIIKLA